MPVLAHAGHWLPELVFALPVFLILGLLVWSKLRDRRHGREEDADFELQPSLDGSCTTSATERSGRPAGPETAASVM